MNENTQVSAGNPRAPAPPRTLEKAGKAEWKRLCAQYVFAAGELNLLAEYCANVDMIALLRAELAATSVTVHSPQAGDVMNRAIAEIRAQQGEMRKLAELLRFRELAVDDEKENFPRLRSADLLHARPTRGQRGARSHRRAV
jgi:phage terminase small subunit